MISYQSQIRSQNLHIIFNFSFFRIDKIYSFKKFDFIYINEKM